MAKKTPVLHGKGWQQERQCGVKSRVWKRVLWEWGHCLVAVHTPGMIKTTSIPSNAKRRWEGRKRRKRKRYVVVEPLTGYFVPF